MTIVYSADDTEGSRWSGVGRLLTAQEVNYNFYQHETRLTAVEAAITVTVSIETITQPTPSTLLFTMTDSSTQGPFTLPTSTFQDRGTWQPSTPYLVNDTFTANGSLYRVIFDHTSASTFSPTANDGAGHDYYAAMMSNPGNALPTGGATGMMLKKSSSTDFAVSWGYALPNGGATNKVLAKLSNSDQDFGWITLGAVSVSFSPSSGSALVSTNVAAALEELEGLIGSGGGGSASISTLSDVEFFTGDPQVGAILYYHGPTTWAASSGPSSVGDLLQWNGAAWDPVAVSSLSLDTAQLRDPTMTALGTTGAVNLDPSLGNVFTVTPTGDLTITATSVPAGAEITLIVITSGATSRTITFDSGTFKSQGTLATGTVSGKYFVVKFVGMTSPASWMVETGRTAAM